MPTKHQKAVPTIEKDRAIITPGLCSTYFETNIGTKGNLFIQRWSNDHSKFRYCASISLNNPGSNTWCGAINIPTANLGEILPWITTTTEQCNEQLRLESVAVIKEALADLAKQFEKFLPMLQAEDDEIKECFTKVTVAT